MNDDLTVDPTHTIPDRELSWTFGPSGGPGGQHANRAHSRAVLSFDYFESVAFDDDEKARLDLAFDDRTIVVVVDESRSQWRNRQMARKRLAERLAVGLRPKPVRKPTRVPRRAREKRLSDKRRQSLRKSDRRTPPIE